MTEREIFLAALKQPTAGERAAFLDQACGSDAKLRGQIEALLAEHEQLGSYLESPVGAGQRTADEPPVAERSGTVIGPYKLLQQIGEGGMGTVFMAEKTQHVQRKVALKVIKPGMDSRQVIARFEAERQALAMMDHVNIARVFDGGTTENGRPYFVMELVHGVPITKYCDDNHLTLRERLELFIPVCQALQHAHQKGIIHRDIKPSNVMVTLYDGKPVPKVIDFGVAKATEQKLTERTLFTQYGTMVGTLEYMSPEQAEMSALGVDTRSDIFSLGVLLYELLTGSTPLTHKRMKEAAYAEILRMIKEEEPPRPSTRLSDSGEALASISAQRKTEPAKLTKLVKGELDWIVMKTLEKDCNRRYETANGFAADVQRYLNDEPVLACPPSAGYRLRKFARRNRAALTSLVLVAAALLTAVVALVISNISISREEKEKSKALVAKDEALKQESEALIAKDAALKDANASRQQAEANLTLILAALDEVYITEAEKRLAAYRSEPNKPAETQDPRQAQVDRDFLQKGMSFYEKLIQPGRAEPAARFQTGKAYRRVGILQSELKQYDKAAEALEKADSLLDRLVKESPTAPQYRWELAHACRWQGEVWPNRKVPQLADAAKAFRRAAALAEELAAESPSNPDYRVHAGTCRFNGGVLLAAMKRTPEAEAEYLAGLKLWQQLVAEFPKERWYRHELAYNLDCLGWLWEGVKQPEKAEPFFRQALRYHEGLVAEDPNCDDSCERLVRTNEHLAQVFTSMGRLPEAKKARRDALAGLEKQQPKNAGAWSSRGLAYTYLEQYDRAVADSTKAIELDPQYARAWRIRGYAYTHLKQYDRALADLTKAIELDPRYANAWGYRGYVYCELKQYDKAVADESKAIELDPTNAVAWHNRGANYYKLKQYDKAVAEYSKAIELDPNYAAAWTSRGTAYGRLKQYERAFADYSRGIELDPQYAAAWRNRGYTYTELKQYDKAVADYSKAIELDPKNADVWCGRGYAYTELKQYDKALADLNTAIDLDPKDESAWSNRGHVYIQLKQYDKALADLNTAIELNPKCAPAWNTRGVAYRNLKQYDKAVADESKAIELDPKNAVAWNNRGDTYRALKEYDKAVADDSEVIKLDPKNPRAWHIRGLTYDRLQQFEKAVADYSKAIELDPKYAIAWGKRGFTYWRLGDWARSLADATRALELNPESPGRQNNLAWYLAACPDGKLRDPRRAVELADKAVKLAPKQGVFWTTLSVARYRAGDWQGAATAAQEALKLLQGSSFRSSFGRASFFLAMAQQHLGKTKDAREAYDQAMTWLKENRKAIEEVPALAAELQRFREETEQLLKNEPGDRQQKSDSDRKPD